MSPDPNLPLPAAAERVQAALAALGSDVRVHVTGQSARTAEEAAAACGCPVGAIVKSLVFLATPATGDPFGVMVLTSGANRVHERRLGRALDVTLARAEVDYVRAATGYAIGGVPPLGHASPLMVVMDQDLRAHAVVWAAGGTPTTVFPISPGDLARITGARILAVT